MAHELATTDGRTAMMFCGDVPWHATPLTLFHEIVKSLDAT
jgi:hypothetical protein